jgi:putative aldouronate transport system permease protein
MAKKEKNLDGLAKFNRVSPVMNVLFSAIFILGAFACTIPLIFIIIISFSSQESLTQVGYSFFPTSWSTSTYEYLWRSKEMLLRSIGISLLVTISGTITGIILNGLLGYVLSRANYKLKPFFTYMILIPMLFGGGMVSSYLIITKFLNLKNNLLVLILPLAVGSMNIVIFRTFFQTTVPEEVIESAKMDGASQLRIFGQIVLPISLPAIATIGLMLCFAYWNDWFTALLYIDNKNLYPLQYLLMKMEDNLQTMKRNAELMGGALAEIASQIESDTVRMAVAVIVVLPIACAYPFFQRYFVGGLTIGAVKG